MNMTLDQGIAVEEQKAEYRAHTIIATAANTQGASWVASFSAWQTPLRSPAVASIRGSIVGSFLSRDQAILSAVNEGMRRLDMLLGPVTAASMGVLGRQGHPPGSRDLNPLR